MPTMKHVLKITGREEGHATSQTLATKLGNEAYK